MTSLFKYLPSKYVDAFVDRGEVFFRSLSYFRSYEELHVRGDRFEGKRLFHPREGLEVTKTEDGETLRLPWVFESSVRERDIFVFCMSLKHPATLAAEFEADVCVEIHEPLKVLTGIRAALQRRPRVKNKRLLHGPVEYCSPVTAPNAAWAVPEQVVMQKTDDYQGQEEYRVAFAVNQALRVNNVATQITTMPGGVQPSLDGHPEQLLRIGSLRRICTIHAFT